MQLSTSNVLFWDCNLVISK